MFVNGGEFNATSNGLIVCQSEGVDEHHLRKVFSGLLCRLSYP
jgi:hypothetical protein